MQQIAWFDEQSGEYGEQALEHSTGEAERFYRELKRGGVQVRVGIEASGQTRWFERLLAELEMELWIGNPAKIAAQRVRKQKTDREDARLLLQLLRENRFPKLWVPSAENRDLRQLLLHRHRLVQMRTRVKNQLHAIALNEGVQRRSRLWSKQGRRQLESFALAPWMARRRHDLLRTAGPVDAADRRAQPGGRAGSPAAAGSAALDDASRSRSDHGTGLRVGAGYAGSFPLRQAGGQLSGPDSLRRFQRRETTPGTPEQAGQHAAALPAGGGGASGGALRPRVAAALRASGHAAATQHRYRRNGTQVGSEFVLAVAKGRGSAGCAPVRFARGVARETTWCVVEHRPFDSGAPLPSEEGSLQS